MKIFNFGAGNVGLNLNLEAIGLGQQVRFLIGYTYSFIR